MRDGTKLFTAIYLPNDLDPEKSYPILLFRTPYSIAPTASINIEVAGLQAPNSNEAAISSHSKTCEENT